MGSVAVAGVIGLVVGGLVGWFALVLAKRRQEQELVAERRLRETQAGMIAQNDLRQRDLMAEMLRAAKAELLKAAQEQLKANEADLSAMNVKSLEPLMTSMKTYQESVQRVERDNIRRDAEFKGQIMAMMDQTNRMTTEANELANAIRGDSQVVGAWGEMQLRKILERAGLEEGIGYTYQETFASEDSTRKDLRTDVLVKMPGDRWVVVDSKNTVEAYVRYMNAAGEPDAQKAKEEILRSVKGHVDELKAAAYGKNVRNAFAYSLAYIPFEEVYLMAVKGEVRVGTSMRSLFDYAWENKVILVNASVLMPALRLIGLMWESSDADRRAKEIIDDANAMCDKFANFLENYIRLGKDVASMAKTYKEGMGQLATGNGNFLKSLNALASTELKSEKRRILSDASVEIAGKIPDVTETVELAETKTGLAAPDGGR